MIFKLATQTFEWKHIEVANAVVQNTRIKCHTDLRQPNLSEDDLGMLAIWDLNLQNHEIHCPPLGSAIFLKKLMDQFSWLVCSRKSRQIVVGSALQRGTYELSDFFNGAYSLLKVYPR